MRRAEREYVVFCLDQLYYGENGFGWFLHEVDYLLLSLAKHVEEGEITVTELSTRDRGVPPALQVGALGASLRLLRPWQLASRCGSPWLSWGC